MNPKIFSVYINLKNPILLNLLGSIAIGFYSFGLMLPWSLLNPKFISWMYRSENALLDIAQSVTAQNAFLSSPWTFPPGTLRNLGQWGNNSLLFSDALPLTLYPIKIFDTLFDVVNEPVQLYGLNALLALLFLAGATVFFVYWETRSHVISFFSSIIICSMPQLFNSWGWPSLMFQGFIILSIWQYRLDSISETKNLRPINWFLLVFLTSLTHSYFVPFVLVLFLASLHWNFKGTFRSKLWAVFCFLFTITLGTFFGGGFNAGIKGSGAGVESVGPFAADLFVYFNAGGISALVRGINSITKVTAFSYVGVSVMALFLAALIILLNDSGGSTIYKKFWRRNSRVLAQTDYLRISMVGFLFFIFSVGPSLTILGNENFITKNPIILSPFAIFRVHARFAWFLPLVLIVACLIVLTRKLGKRKTSFFLLFLLGIHQLEFDNYFTQQRSAITQFFQEGKEVENQLNPSSPLYFVPGFPDVLTTPWRDYLIPFLSEGGVVKNFAYMNRYSSKRVGDANALILEMFSNGALPTSSYVMVSQELLAGVKQEYKIHKEYENWVLIYIN